MMPTFSCTGCSASISMRRDVTLSGTAALTILPVLLAIPAEEEDLAVYVMILFIATILVVAVRYGDQNGDHWEGGDF